MTGGVNFVIESEIPPSTRGGIENLIELTVGGIIENMTKKLVKPVPPFKKKGQKMVPHRKKGKKMYLPPKKMVEKNGQFCPPPGGVNFVIEFEIPLVGGGTSRKSTPRRGDTPPPKRNII